MNANVIQSQPQLISALAEGFEAEYIFFWGFTQKDTSIIDKSCLCQWYEASFEIGDQLYPTAEHYMMAEKARLFNDSEAEHAILQTEQPADAKNLGRSVRNYNEKAWRAHRFEIVVNANIEKFKQNESLKRYLMETQDKILVEASPYDKIWGIGLKESDFGVTNPAHWRGLNLLGFALMNVRQQFIE